jgi:hypothetical protein
VKDTASIVLPQAVYEYGASKQYRVVGQETCRSGPTTQHAKSLPLPLCQLLTALWCCHLIQMLTLHNVADGEAARWCASGFQRLPVENTWYRIRNLKLGPRLPVPQSQQCFLLVEQVAQLAQLGGGAMLYAVLMCICMQCCKTRSVLRREVQH